MKPLSLYIHIPFCERKCPYCDFYSLTGSAGLQRQFVRALLIEIDRVSAHFSETPPLVETLFFGGGTPSLLPTDALEDIFRSLRSRFQLAPAAEITIEANPGTVDQGKFEAYFSMGFNRISLGVQSFRDEELRQLGRIHTAAEAETAIQSARKAGFSNISLDLIFGIPGQTLSHWQENLEKVLRWQPAHISTYNLIYEANTPFGRARETGTIKPLDEQIEWDMYRLTVETLQANGYSQYEISNFSLPGKACRHNQNYWNGTAYLGMGPSAHSFQGKKRWWNVRDVTAYISRLQEKKLPIDGQESLSSQQRKMEFIFLSLRQKRGLSLSAYRDQFGTNFLEEFSHSIDIIRKTEEKTGPLLVLQNDRLFFTTKGFWLSDSLFEWF
ncbi:MAG: radical SAM family heme chaperone HemW [Calditrichaeota bacterium]|nr:radical SAM family heme chaperone HemW [Calditrichota bacterium]